MERTPMIINAIKMVESMLLLYESLEKDILVKLHEWRKVLTDVHTHQQYNTHLTSCASSNVSLYLIGMKQLPKRNAITIDSACDEDGSG